MDLRCPVRLQPRSLPGRSNRKALVFQPEIHRLREEGYSLDAIRAALADAGVCVSKSTVRREAGRSRARWVAPAPTTLRLDQNRTTALGVVANSLVGNDVRSGKDIARDFFDGRITNPLLLARGHR